MAPHRSQRHDRWKPAFQTAPRLSDGQLPRRAILARQELLCFRATFQEPLALDIPFQPRAGAQRDVAEDASRRRAMNELDVALWPLALLHAIEHIGDVIRKSVVYLLHFHGGRFAARLAVDLDRLREDFKSSAVHKHRSFRSVELNSIGMTF